MDKFKRFRFFFYLPVIIIGLLCTIVFDWALYVQEEKPYRTGCSRSRMQKSCV